MTLEVTRAALSDLQSIRNYTLERMGGEQKQRYLDALWQKFGGILFREDGSVLHIVRILHPAMDFPRHLRDERESE